MSVDSPAQEAAPNITRLLEEWFVLYNPFYFGSACLTLSGAWQLSLGIAALDWRDGRVLPACVLALYQLLLALACVAVARKGTIRPAVILALLSTLLVVDPTLQHVQIAVHAGRAIGLVVAIGSLLVLAVVRAMISRALHLSFSRSFSRLLALTASGIALAPHVLDARLFERNDAYLLLEVWGAAIVILAVRFPVRISTLASDEWTTTVARRAGVYLSALFPAAALLHLKSWADVFEPGIDWRSFVMVAMAVMVVIRSESMTWLGALIAIGIASFHPDQFSPVLLLLAALLLLLWRLGLSYRLAIGALVTAWAGMACWGWQGGPLPDAPAWVTILACALLASLALRLRTFVPLLPVPLMALMSDWGISDMSATARGTVLLLSGFFLLAAGVAANLWAKTSKNGGSMRSV